MKSSVTGATLAFLDGYETLTLTPTGTNVDSGFGYLVERSEDNSTWTPVAGGSGMVTDGSATVSVTITQQGYYRAQAQGTDAGARVRDVTSKIIYTPTAGGSGYILLTPNYISDPSKGVQTKHGSSTLIPTHNGPTLYNNTTEDFLDQTRVDYWTADGLPEVILTSVPEPYNYGDKYYIFNEWGTTSGEPGGDNASWTVLANTGNIKINLGTNRYINRIQFFVGNIGTAANGVRNPTAQTFQYSLDDSHIQQYPYHL